MFHALWRAGRRAVPVVLLLLLAAPVRAAAPEPPGPAAGDRTVAVGDVVLGYRILGQGKPLLLLTGYGCTMDTWDPAPVGRPGGPSPADPHGSSGHGRVHGFGRAVFPCPFSPRTRPGCWGPWASPRPTSWAGPWGR